MAKRFTASDKWEDPWFRKLPLKAKLFWLFLLDRCDIAGVWKSDYELASFSIGEMIDKSILAEFQGRVEPVNGDKLWIVRFVEFQYGVLKEEVKLHKSVMNILDKHGLLERVVEGLAKGYPRVI